MMGEHIKKRTSRNSKRSLPTTQDTTRGTHLSLRMASDAACVKVVLFASAYACRASKASRSIMTRGSLATLSVAVTGATGAGAGAAMAAAGAATAETATAPGTYSLCAFLIDSNPTRLTQSPKRSVPFFPAAKPAKMGSKKVSISVSFTLSWYGLARVSKFAVPPSQIWYDEGPSPTNPSSAMYGRAQPLGQPVIRIKTVSSLGRPTLVIVARNRLLISGKPRSASVIARPHKGNAGHAMESASIGSKVLGSSTPPAVSVAVMSAFHAGSISVSNRSWFAVSRTGSS
mmetsp:Transcript_12136/g.40284  ORF Transcript_12136/g.40284 Transcript_12136/m.40284 type:complete len:287 (+) Transcript_12136:87-947(+)